MGLAQDTYSTKKLQDASHQYTCEASCKALKRSIPHMILLAQTWPLACPLHQRGKKIPTEFTCSTRSLINCISAFQLARCLAGEILLHRHYSQFSVQLITTQLRLLGFGLLITESGTYHKCNCTSSRRQLEAWKHRGPPGECAGLLLAAAPLVQTSFSGAFARLWLFFIGRTLRRLDRLFLANARSQQEHGACSPKSGDAMPESDQGVYGVPAFAAAYTVYRLGVDDGRVT